MATPATNATCLFCKIIKGEIPSFKLVETKHSFSFLDIQPTAEAHLLVIPKYHGAKLHNIPDEYLADILPVVKKLTKALHLDENNTPDGEGYNVLQNNGRIAHQVVDHVHFHLIPKKNDATGLGVGWPAQETDFDKLGALHKVISEELKKLDESEKL
ncbi:kinase C inhibitor-I, histidine triad nucleotide-binding protein-like protein [Scheffersomyces xylosifermentans]|uniref:kinase C inhibitor-I, histidine triad nucleotide-binding protein-like protein n=1 Tax=Scheffersomyces xylosifermentans TaxID=1304137 RepID=UPI00315C9F9C